jgi:uncharacterized protein with PIN domain
MKMTYDRQCPTTNCGKPLVYIDTMTTCVNFSDYNRNQMTDYYECPECGEKYMRTYKWEKMEK